MRYVFDKKKKEKYFKLRGEYTCENAFRLLVKCYEFNRGLFNSQNLKFKITWHPELST